MRRQELGEAAERFVAFNMNMVPRYWEPPELLDDYVKMWKRDG